MGTVLHLKKEEGSLLPSWHAEDRFFSIFIFERQLAYITNVSPTGFFFADFNFGIPFINYFAYFGQGGGEGRYYVCCQKDRGPLLMGRNLLGHSWLRHIRHVILCTPSFSGLL